MIVKPAMLLPMQTLEHETSERLRAFHILAKPIGPICNLDCKYCFYLEKEKLYQDEKSWKMDPELLERYIQSYIEAQDTPRIDFAWQGGEPTLLGIDFFKQVLAFQEKHCPPNKRIYNALQTNGTNLNDEWGQFLSDNGFLVGLSIDGPAHLHNKYRVDKGGNDTHERVVRGAEILNKYNVEYNALCVVNRYNAKEPLRVYHFLKTLGTQFFQFIPIVECAAEQEELLDLSSPPQIREHESPVTGWSVHSEDYGDFLNAIFDEWVRNDIGQYYVQIFDIQLELHMGQPSSLCIFKEQCGEALAVEHNGDLYACDHYVYPEYHLGNLKDNNLSDMVNCDAQRAFGKAKQETLPKQCRDCQYLNLCNGECPKNRFLKSIDGEDGLNYLCKGFQRFFKHTTPYFKRMCDLLYQRRAPAELMLQLSHELQQFDPKRVKPNDPCPCGSGKKFKVCHLPRLRA